MWAARCCSRWKHLSHKSGGLSFISRTIVEENWLQKVAPTSMCVSWHIWAHNQACTSCTQKVLVIINKNWSVLIIYHMIIYTVLLNDGLNVAVFLCCIEKHKPVSYYSNCCNRMCIEFTYKLTSTWLKVLM